MRPTCRRWLARGAVLFVATGVLAGPGLVSPFAAAAEVERQAEKKGAAQKKPEPKKPEPAVKRAARKGGPAWGPLKKGLADLRAKDRAALVLWPGTSTEDESFAAALDELLGKSTFRSVLRGFVLVRLDPADLERPWPVAEDPKAAKAKSKKGPRTRRGTPVERGGAPVADGPTGRRRLGLTSTAPQLIVLSFREEVVERFRGELPSASELKKKLTRIAKVNKIFAAEDKRVGKYLEKSLYAFENGKRRAGVLLVKGLEEPKAQRRMDDALKQRVKELLERYRTAARKDMDKADLLDRQARLDAALELYENVRRDFPLQDINQRATRRIGEIWRKLNMATGRQRP